MSDSLLLRKALVTEAPQLSELAFRSKAYWGYSNEFMAACREELAVPAHSIEDSGCWVIVAIDQTDVVGFYILENHSDSEVELGGLFVEPSRIGSGIGKALMQHASQQATRLGALKLIIQSDPNALEFYRAGGAVVIGEKESSSFPGRLLPLLEIRLVPVDAVDSCHTEVRTLHES
jgi:GNAT superfamily N-acetyltransferase